MIRLSLFTFRLGLLVKVSGLRIKVSGVSAKVSGDLVKISGFFIKILEKTRIRAFLRILAKVEADHFSGQPLLYFNRCPLIQKDYQISFIYSDKNHLIRAMKTFKTHLLLEVFFILKNNIIIVKLFDFK